MPCAFVMSHAFVMRTILVRSSATRLSCNVLNIQEVPSMVILLPFWTHECLTQHRAANVNASARVVETNAGRKTNKEIDKCFESCSLQQPLRLPSLRTC